MKRKKIAAVVLAAGQGTRMNSSVQKVYLELAGKPVLYYSLHQFQQSPVDEIIITAGESEVEYCQKEIVEHYGFSKVVKVIKGGRERFESVHFALQAIEDADYVLIHDAARALVSQEIIARSIEGAKNYKACVIGMPVKDTIKIADDQCFASQTPPRSQTWLIQTPQAFDYSLIKKAYEKLIQSGNEDVTDDAMVVEQYAKQRVKLIEGSYQNIKITTPEDLEIAKTFMKS